MPIPRRTEVSVTGPSLYLTEDREALSRQLRGERLRPAPDPERLIDNISTDEITPGWVCYYYDATLARYCLVGLRGGAIERDAIQQGGFSILLSGRSKGCGSSRETAPYAEREAGVVVVCARSIEKIYGQNCQNIGLLTTTDFSLIERLEDGEAIPIDAFTRGLDPISKDVVEYGGLFQYNRARLRGEVSPPPLRTAPRPMTLAEKIIARRAVVDAETAQVGVAAVEPGQSLFVRTDVRFSHEYVTPMAEALFVAGFGEEAEINDPASVFAFRDHLTFLDRVMPQRHIDLGLREQARSLKTVQAQWADKHHIRLFGEVERNGRTVGSEAICHNKVIEELALPGDVVLGTDSHTCMAGSLGAFAFGVGATDMANAWRTKDVRLAVPETVRFELTGALCPGVAAKDVMLHILAQPFWRSGNGIGKVLQFIGEGVRRLGLDERSTLTNMAVEAGGFTGIIEADDVVVDFLVRERGLERGSLEGRLLRADPDADYAHTFTIDLREVQPMVATPGDPRNGVPLRELGPTAIDIAYGGSCTGGKRADMDMYHAVLKRALDEGRSLAEGVLLYIQFGSQVIRDYAIDRGYVETFERMGVELIDPSCGACIKAGPGVSFLRDQVTVSAINRNYPGRSGPGQVYLASPYVVAASALAGRIAAPDQGVEVGP
ncbi:MAG: aconitase family protein [Myxococcota bacterium]